MHRELRRPGVTLQLLWEEHQAAHPEGYGYSRFCELYRQWEGRLSATMRQVHVAGERMFVDYADTTLTVMDGTTGELEWRLYRVIAHAGVERSYRSIVRSDE
jgi:transposase